MSYKTQDCLSGSAEVELSEHVLVSDHFSSSGRAVGPVCVCVCPANNI